MISELLVFIVSYKLKCAACEKGSSKQRQLMNIAVNYLSVPVYSFFFGTVADLRAFIGIAMARSSCLQIISLRRRREIVKSRSPHGYMSIGRLLSCSDGVL